MFRLSLLGALGLLSGVLGAALSVASPEPTQERPHLMAAEDDASWRAVLPRTASPRLNALLADPQLILYTDGEMPPAYQLHGGAHSPAYNISARAGEPHGNANKEFPWGAPFGTHRGHVPAVRFAHFPSAIEWWTEKLERVALPVEPPSLRWSYPEGATFGEALFVTDKRGAKYAFEVRTRTKVSGKWHPNVFRPFRDRAQLAEWLADQPERITLVPPQTTTYRLRNPHPNRTSVDVTAVADELPALPEEVVKRALNLPFSSVFSKPWITQGEMEGFAPTVSGGFSIVPPDYAGALFRVDKSSCMDCHRDVLNHVDYFDLKRDWYGRVRGDDGIFSFHPFDPACISTTGNPLPVRLRKELVDAGLLVQRRGR